MKKITKSIFLIALLVMMSAFAITSYAEPGEDKDVRLDYQIVVNENFKYFISESDNEVGELILDGPEKYKIYSGSINLKPEKTYYLHIQAEGSSSYGGFAGKFVLNGEQLQFGNNNNVLLSSNIKDFKVSITGFGVYNDKLKLSGNVYFDSQSNFKSIAKSFWTNAEPGRVRYISAKISPTSQVLIAQADDNPNSVNLSWNSITGATSYSVERSATAGGPYTQIATDLTETSYTDMSVAANTTYYYIVKAKLSDTETVTSSEVSGTPTTETPTVDSKLKVVLEPTESLQLSIDDNLAINANMTWTSSDNTVATVNEKGVVTALAPGNTVITVKSPDNTYTDYINVLVVEDASDYRLAIDLKVGQSARLTVDDLTNTVNATWEPMDSAIANVTSKGKVTALKKGLVLFTAKGEEGNVIGKVYVRVRE